MIRSDLPVLPFFFDQTWHSESFFPNVLLLQRSKALDVVSLSQDEQFLAQGVHEHGNDWNLIIPYNGEAVKVRMTRLIRTRQGNDGRPVISIIVQAIEYCKCISNPFTPLQDWWFIYIHPLILANIYIDISCIILIFLVLRNNPIFGNLGIS